jgi:membrane fusion protein (multidrug efflux system)
MNARVQTPAQGEAQIVKLSPATAEAPNPAQPGPGQAAGTTGLPEAPPKKRRGVKRLTLMIAVPLVLIVAGGYYWLTGGRYEDTDNAYVQQPKVSLSADVAGTITAVDVKENQTVKAGDELFRIDATPYQIALNQANAALAAARQSVTQLRVAYSTAQTKLTADQQTLVIQQRAQSRNNDLAKKGVATAATVDQGLLALQQAQAAVDEDQQAVKGALAALGGDADVKTDDVPAVQQALAAVDAAKRNLAKTTVKAPAAGVISQVDSLNVGQFVGTGTTIVSLVESGDTWVEANFKETQLEHMKAGEPADVTIDSYPGVVLHGTIDSIGAATGSEFALIPAQNATGNWVKVVQRLPVRVKLPADPGVPLRTGMSAGVTVDTGKTRLDMMQHS